MNASLKQQFNRLFGEGEVRIFEAAGRVNLIGEHVDYNGGQVLPAALSLKNRIAVRRREDNLIKLRATTLDGEVVLDIDRLDDYRRLPWGSYQAGVAFVLQQRGVNITGCDMLYDCDVPFGAGLSSSAAIEVSTAHALLALAGEKYTKTDLAKIGRQAENEYVGVSCGIMDQFASAMGKRNNAILLNCATLDYSYIPLDFGMYKLVISNTNKPRSLVLSKYNERRAECDEALAILGKKTGIQNLSELSFEDFGRYRGLLSRVCAMRVEHVIGECARVRQSANALQRGDNTAFGALLDESHLSLKELYEVSCTELDALVSAAHAQRGVLGSRMTGAGFGGCTISLVHADAVDDFVAGVTDAYYRAVNIKPSFYLAEVSSGAREVK